MSGFTLGKKINGNIKVRVRIIPNYWSWRASGNSYQMIHRPKKLDCNAMVDDSRGWELYPAPNQFSVLSRRWHRLRLFCKEALIASKSYQELCASVDSLQDVLGVSSETVENSTNDESTLQVRQVFLAIAYVLTPKGAVAPSLFVVRDRRKKFR